MDKLLLINQAIRKVKSSKVTLFRVSLSACLDDLRALEGGKWPTVPATKHSSILPIYQDVLCTLKSLLEDMLLITSLDNFCFQQDMEHLTIFSQQVVMSGLVRLLSGLMASQL